MGFITTVSFEHMMKTKEGVKVGQGLLNHHPDKLANEMLPSAL